MIILLERFIFTFVEYILNGLTKKLGCNFYECCFSSIDFIITLSINPVLNDTQVWIESNLTTRQMWNFEISWVVEFGGKKFIEKTNKKFGQFSNHKPGAYVYYFICLEYHWFIGMDSE